MKKVLALAVFMSAAAAATVPAQTKELKFGVKAGANLAMVNLSPDDDVSPDALVGITGGVYASIPLHAGLALQPEVLFSQQGLSKKRSQALLPIILIT